MVTELEVKAYNGIRSNPSVANCSICFWVDKEKNTYLCFFVHYIDRQWLPHTILLKFQCLASDPIDTFIKELGNMLKSNFVAISQRNLCDTDEPDLSFSDSQTQNLSQSSKLGSGHFSSSFSLLQSSRFAPDLICSFVIAPTHELLPTSRDVCDSHECFLFR